MGRLLFCLFLVKWHWLLKANPLVGVAHRFCVGLTSSHREGCAMDLIPIRFPFIRHNTTRNLGEIVFPSLLESGREKFGETVN